MVLSWPGESTIVINAAGSAPVGPTDHVRTFVFICAKVLIWDAGMLGETAGNEQSATGQRIWNL
jgi:hypothetical protein